MIDDKKIACDCRNISYKKIRDEVLSGNKEFETIKAKLKFGKGCGQCNEFIEHMIRDFIEEDAVNENNK